jgi:hypothetical protein
MREQAGERSYRSPDATGATAIRWQYRTTIQGGHYLRQILTFMEADAEFA